MRFRAIALLCVGSLLAIGCKDPERAAAEARQRTGQERLTEGRKALSDGRFEQAVAALKLASAALPDDPAPHLLMAEAYRRGGKDAAAALALKQAEQLLPKNDTSLRRQRVELFRQMGQKGAAIALLVELRDSGALSDDEVLALARSQAREGDYKGARETLGHFREKRPEDPEAEVVEVEILLLSGETMRAAQRMDELLSETPGLVSARLLRARYFLEAGYPDVARRDLEQLSPEASKLPAVGELKAQVLNRLERYDEALEALRPLLEEHPDSPELLSMMAETRLQLRQIPEALSLVDQALAVRSRFPRALYVRGRAQEAEGDLKAAVESYEYALRADPTFAAALSRVWRVYKHRGEKIEAISALERLTQRNQASPEEKLALAEMYVSSNLHLDRARTILVEAMKKDPRNPGYKELLRQLEAQSPKKNKKQGIIIMRNTR